MDTVLQFGGGKDSLACLHLLKPRWDDILVVWVNTGAAFPEVIELMDEVRSIVPHFHEVKSDVLSDIERNGIPVDVLPVMHTQFNRTINSTGPLMRPWVNCCGKNMWEPLQKAMDEIKPKTIIRGQRLTESYKSAVRHGDVINGIRYEMPIQDWTETMVFDYLRDNGIEIPHYYDYTGTSLDCWNCTAYMDAKVGQVKYMKKYHPEKYQVVLKNLWAIDSAVKIGMKHIEAALNG
jgi:phosphoadenosine phosphosulfate reductase